MPSKVLTDPQGLNQALQSGIQAVNGFAFDAAAAANGAAYPEAYQVSPCTPKYESTYLTLITRVCIFSTRLKMLFSA